jgi:SNF2 family DNA or RNA helicase
MARHRAGFFDDQGLGKTISALVAGDMIARAIVVVCPTVVLYNWAREAEVWTNRKVAVLAAGRDKYAPDTDLIVTTHGMLLSANIMAQLEAFAPDLLIGDEVHMLRGRAGKKADAFFGELVPPAQYVWALTGTPMPSWPTDMWRMLSGLWPDEFPEDFDSFRERYCILVPSNYGDGVRIVGTRNLTDLRARMAGKMLRRLKSEELDLPPLRHEEITLHARLPHEMLNLDGVLTTEAVEQLAAATSIEQAFRVLLDDTDLASYRRRCGEMKAPLVAELVDMELRDDPKAKRVIFCHHKAVAHVLRDRLKRFGVVCITGDTPAKQRTRAVELFQTTDSVRVAVCQIVAGGAGVTLTASDDVIFAECSFVPGDNAQARDRIYRIGQTKPCRVRFASLHGTVDEIIMRALRRKTAAIQGVLG